MLNNQRVMLTLKCFILVSNVGTLLRLLVVVSVLKGHEVFSVQWDSPSPGSPAES